MRFSNLLRRCVLRQRQLALLRPTLGPRLILIMSTVPKQLQLFSRVQSAFDEAVISGDLLFFPSTVHPYLDSGVQVRIPLLPWTLDRIGSGLTTRILIL
jgi:hypothetical protein